MPLNRNIDQHTKMFYRIDSNSQTLPGSLLALESATCPQGSQVVLSTRKTCQPASLQGLEAIFQISVHWHAARPGQDLKLWLQAEPGRADKKTILQDSSCSVTIVAKSNDLDRVDHSPMYQHSFYLLNFCSILHILRQLQTSPWKKSCTRRWVSIIDSLSFKLSRHLIGTFLRNFTFYCG